MRRRAARTARRLLLPLTLAFALAPAASRAQTVWTGPTITFSKAAFADPTLPANQDPVLPGVVSITRGDARGVYNAETETFFSPSTSPDDTEWAFPDNNPGVTVSAANYAALQFDAWQTAHGNNALGITNVPSVMHILSADIYLDVRVTAWSAGMSGGAFTWERSTPAKVPGAHPALLAAALAATGVAFTARRARRRTRPSPR